MSFLGSKGTQISEPLLGHAASSGQLRLPAFIRLACVCALRTTDFKRRLVELEQHVLNIIDAVP